MIHQQGMASLLAATSLVLITGLLGWLTCQSVSAETTRSQQQLFAAQALATSEALLETALASLDSQYAALGVEADAAFWLRASPNACPATKPAPVWQCVSWPLTQLPLPEWTDPLTSTVVLIRHTNLSPQVATLWVDARLNSLHAGVGSRATLQQSLILPNAASPIPATRVQRLAGSWKNAGF